MNFYYDRSLAPAAPPVFQRLLYLARAPQVIFDGSFFRLAALESLANLTTERCY